MGSNINAVICREVDRGLLALQPSYLSPRVGLFRLLQAVGSLFAAAGGAGFLDGLFDRFPGFTGALLNPANKFFLLAFGELEIVIRELGPLLFQLALGNVPVALNFEFIHNNSSCILFTASVTAKMFSELVCCITVS